MLSGIYHSPARLWYAASELSGHIGNNRMHSCEAARSRSALPSPPPQTPHPSPPGQAQPTVPAGLAADSSSRAAVEAIYAIKGRATHVPLAVCLADAESAPRYGRCEHLPPGLLAALLPGPVTVLLQRQPDAPLAAKLTSSSPLIGAHSLCVGAEVSQVVGRYRA